MQGSQRAAGSELEDGATTIAAVLRTAAGSCRPVEVSITGLNQPSKNVAAIGKVEAVQRGEAAARGDLENRAATEGTVLAGATRRCRAIEVSIRGLKQRPVGRRAIRSVEVVQRGQAAGGGDPEDRAVDNVAPAGGSCAVKVAVAALHQAGKRSATIVFTIETIEGGQRAVGRDFEDRAKTVGAFIGSGAIEVPVAGLQQRAGGSKAIASHEAVQQGEAAAGSDLKYRPIRVSAACRGSPVKVAIAALYQPSVRIGAVGAVRLGAKAVQRSQRAARGHLKYRATAVCPSTPGRSVEIAVGALDERPEERLSPVRPAEVDQRGEGLRRRGNRRRSTKQKCYADHCC